MLSLKKTVVLAEPDREDEDILLLALETSGIDMDIVVLRDGSSVLDFFMRRDRSGSEAAQHRCALLLLDLTLPKLEGIKVLRQLRWLYRDEPDRLAPIVALSSSDDCALIAEAYRHGANGFLYKGAPVVWLVDMVRQTARYWLSSTLHPTRLPAPLAFEAPLAAVALDRSS